MARRGNEMTDSKTSTQIRDAKPDFSPSREGGFLLAIQICLAVFLVGLAIYQVYLFNTAANDQVMAVLGQRGDFFGGFLNPILTAFTLGGLFYTLHLQRAEQHEARQQFARSSKALADQNDMIRQQNYQAGFFQLLAIHNDLVNSLKTFDTNEKVDVVGRDAFGVMYSRLTRKYRSKRAQFPQADDRDVLIFAWDDLFRDDQSQLAHYFRYLFNTIRLLSEGQEADRYVRLLRAQLSNPELLMLFYNTAVGQHGKPFVKYAVDFELFDNIPPRLIEASHGSLVPHKAFGAGGYSGVLERNKPRLKGDLTAAGPLKAKAAPKVSDTVAAPAKGSASGATSKSRPKAQSASTDPEALPKKKQGLARKPSGRSDRRKT